MVEEIGRGTEFGRLLGSGPAAVGKHFNHDRVPVVKGQSIAAYDPRAMLGHGSHLPPRPWAPITRQETWSEHICNACSIH